MDFIEELNLEGDVYLVGGIVRDRIYNIIYDSQKKPKDYDIVITKMKIDRIYDILLKHGHVKKVGIKFSILSFYSSSLDITFDIATPRTEISTGPKYKDFIIKTSELVTLEEDCIRRDASINSLALQIYKIDDLFKEDVSILENVKDYIGGIDAIKNKLWKAIVPFERFQEDATRILRGIRQCSQLDFELEDETMKSMIINFDMINEILKESSSRVTNEIVRTLISFRSDKWINFLVEIDKNSILSLQSTDLKYADEQNYESWIKLPLIIKGNPIKWIKKYNLNACPNFPVEYSKFVEHVEKAYNIFQTNPRLGISYIKDKDNKTDDYTKMFLKYILLKDSSKRNSTFISEYMDNINVPKNVNAIMINGKYLMEKYNIYGKEINNIKIKVYYEIINNKLKNDESNIKEYLKTFMQPSLP
ncbi:MAG: hypothetical protein CMF62_02775 [Magnetococcales bacterium]|nr:hypothetical protein [Magnetococcales bacterium]|tara:strand:+ start:29191 stop:30447 length:1257 start_codon:yes stop_codon:yes gene_type:complete